MKRLVLTGLAVAAVVLVVTVIQALGREQGRHEWEGKPS